MEQLKFKNAVYSILYVACFATICTTLGCLICVVVTCVFEQSKDLYLGLMIFGGVMTSIWIVACLAIVFSKTVVISSTEISMYRGKKIKWSIKKEELIECIYNKMHWYYCFFPLSTINAYCLQFKIRDKGISKRYCMLSLRQVNKIKEIFKYPIREIDTIQEQ